MTEQTDPSIEAYHDEIALWVGRCVLRLQTYEKRLKALLPASGFSGSAKDVETKTKARNDDVSGMTLGGLISDFCGSVLSPIPPDDQWPDEIDDDGGLPQVSFQFHLGLSDEDRAQWVSGLRDLVKQRNLLVHNFIDAHDLTNAKGCKAAIDALEDLYERLGKHREALGDIMGNLSMARQEMSKALRSEEFLSALKIEPIESSLHDAFKACAKGGWAPVAQAGQWIEERYPQQTPQKLGHASWKAIIHEAPNFEIKKMDRNGRREAFYREKTPRGSNGVRKPPTEG